VKLFDSQGRELCDLEFDGRGKADTFLARATYLDDGSDVPEHELEFSTKAMCLCYECRETTGL
jgi:hypothetical protein